MLKFIALPFQLVLWLVLFIGALLATAGFVFVFIASESLDIIGWPFDSFLQRWLEEDDDD